MTETDRRTHTDTHTDPHTDARTHIDLAPEDVGAGLAQIVLVVLRLLHELLERQAIRRVDEGALSDVQIDALGTTLQQARAQLDHLQSILVSQGATGPETADSQIQQPTSHDKKGF